MDTGLATIISAILTGIVTILATIISVILTGIVTFFVAQINKAKKSVVEAEKSIKKVSGDLPSWNLLFEHDEQGEPITGDVEKLIEAVNKGYPIKVRIHFSNNKIHVMEAQWLFIDNETVFASNTNQISLKKNDSGNYIYQEDSYHYYVIVGSDGHHHATRIYIDGRKRKSTDSKRHMAWIGLVPAQMP